MKSLLKLTASLSYSIQSSKNYHGAFLGTILKRHFNSSSSGLEDRNTHNIWQATLRSQNNYWKGYLSTRPKYSEDLYKSIYKYHATNSTSPSFSVAHDVGAGPGQVSEKLASKFKHVVVSDNNAHHVEYAQWTLGNMSAPHTSPFSYVVSRGEDLHKEFPPGSADLIVNALTFPLMDTSAALHSFQTLLKPNGTLAIWFYGRAHFSEPHYAAKCQPLLDRIINHHFAGVIQQNRGPEYTAQWKHAADGIASWLDYIPFAPEQWYAVERWKWNSSWTNMGFFGQQACDFRIETRSKVRDNEAVIEIEDAGLWKKEWDVQDVRRFVQYIFPFTQMHDEPVEGTWEELERNMGGHGRRRAFSWPVVLILAARR